MKASLKQLLLSVACLALVATLPACMGRDKGDRDGYRSEKSERYEKRGGKMNDGSKKSKKVKKTKKVKRDSQGGMTVETQETRQMQGTRPAKY